MHLKINNNNIVELFCVLGFSEMENFFYYFGYGSNLLAKRIKIQNKSAERVGVGILNDFRLDFADAALDTR
jgi:hypothetical protein